MPTALKANPVVAPPLVVRFGAVGDMVMTTPLLRALAERHGQPCDVLGRGGWLSAVFKHLPFVGRVQSLRSLYWPPLWLSPDKQRIVSWLQERGNGPVYLLQTDRHTMRMITRSEVAISAFNEQFDRQLNEHTCDRMLRIGGFGADARRGTELATSADELDEVDRWLATLGCAGKPLVLIQPGNRRTRRFTISGRDTKVWPDEHWSTLIRGVLAHLPEARVLVIGSPKEQPLAARLTAACNDPRALAVADQLPMRRLFALLRRAHSLISVDTGPAHAAAALGCPCVVIFGRTDPRITGPSSMGSPVIPVLPPLARGLGPQQVWPKEVVITQVPVADVVQAWMGLPTASP